MALEKFGQVAKPDADDAEEACRESNNQRQGHVLALVAAVFVQIVGDKRHPKQGAVKNGSSHGVHIFLKKVTLLRKCEQRYEQNDNCTWKIASRR